MYLCMCLRPWTTDVHAFRRLLSFCHRDGLPPHSKDPLGVPSLIRLLLISDRFQVPTCLAAYSLALSKRDMDFSEAVDFLCVSKSGVNVMIM